jgi:hypothetical protein
MKPRIAILALALLVSCAAPPPDSAPRKLAVELAGRTAGAPQRCVLIQQNEALRISTTDRHMLLYGSGRTVFANALSPGCGFGAEDIPISEPLGSYHCRGDIVRSVDRFSGIPGPACVLGDFVPFSR